jgi:hypothetical protein
MTPRELIARAVGDAAAKVEAGYRADEKRPENRLRFAFADSLRALPGVVEICTSPEWRPEMPFWPWGKDQKTKLGGFDVSVRFEGDTGYSMVAELKWSRYGIIDAIDEALWDAFKLAHATSTLEGVTDGVLVYLAPLRAWEKPARFAALFDNAMSDSRALIEDNEASWRWSLENSSACRPTKLPPSIESQPLARAGLLIGGIPWELRAASITANGTPWLDVGTEGWPVGADRRTAIDLSSHPEPGPGMVETSDLEHPPFDSSELPSSELRVGDVPGPSASWNEITAFAARFDGYAHYGNGQLGELANDAAAHWGESGRVESILTLDQLRGCLFFEYRRFHHFGHVPGTSDTPYIRALVESLRIAVEHES